MKIVTVLFFLAACQSGFAGGDTNIIAMSDWSKPVANSHNHSLRVRMILAYGQSPAHSGLQPETQVYLEFQNLSGSIANIAPTQFFFDPAAGLRCEVRDANGLLLRPSGGNILSPGASWIILPYDSTIRLRANPAAFGSAPGEGLILVLHRQGEQYWWIRAGDTNTYYLSGTFTATTPTNFVPKDTYTGYAVWSGTLELPKTKVYDPKR